MLGVEQGIGVAVALAILDRTRLTARPHLHVLGRIPGTTSWAPLSSHGSSRQVPGVLVVLFATPLWYANANHFRDAAARRARATRRRPARAVVLDALGMSDIDYTGVAGAADVLDELDTGIDSRSRAPAPLRDELRRAGMRRADRREPLLPRRRCGRDGAHRRESTEL